MTPDQLADFERRLIRKAFEAGILGCDLDHALNDIGDAMGHDVSYSEYESDLAPLLARLSAPDGPLRSMDENDWLALSIEEWGKRIALAILGDVAPTQERAIADLLRGKSTDVP